MFFEVKQLHYLVLAAEVQSFARAAALLGIKQSTLSRHISDLERRLGVRLFERSTRGAQLTSAGTSIVVRARGVLGEIDELEITARRLASGEAADMAIGFCTPLAASPLRAILVEFLSRFPELKLHGFEQGRAQLRHQLQRGTIDLAVISGWIPLEGILRRSLWSERVLVALPDKHALADRDRIYWSDLRDERFVFSEQDPGPDLLELLCSRVNEPGRPPNVSSQSISRENVLSLVNLNRFLTLTTDAALGVTHPSIVLREVHDLTGPSRVSCAAYWREDNQSSPLGRFLDLLHERYPG